jgi:hypothetical protein
MRVLPEPLSVVNGDYLLLPYNPPASPRRVSSGNGISWVNNLTRSHPSGAGSSTIRATKPSSG